MSFGSDFDSFGEPLFYQTPCLFGSVVFDDLLNRFGIDFCTQFFPNSGIWFVNRTSAWDVPIGV